MSAVRDRADRDPVVARYNVFLKPALPAHQKLLVLQYPNRVNKSGGGGGGGGGGPNGGAPGVGGTPTELRMKAGSGMVEVDVPLDYSTAYDRAKGQAWGAALAQSTKAKAGGSHGLAGGFGVGGAQGGRSGRGGGGGGGSAGGGSGTASSGQEAMAAAATAAAAAAAEAAEAGGGGSRFGQSASAAGWSEAVRQDRVLRLQTLGGMCPPPRIAEARWMIGVFDGGNLHLTPVSALVHLRPQLHHIDAESEMERAKHRDGGGMLGGGGGGGGGMGGGGGGGGGGSSGGPAPRAIHMTIKSAGADGDEKMVTETMADRLRAVQLEPWSRMQYVPDDDEHSWDVFDDTFFLRKEAAKAAAEAGAAQTEPATAAAAADDDDDMPIDPALEDGAQHKGKEVAGAAAATAQQQKQQAQPPLVALTPALRTAWTEDDMLQAISKIQKPAPATAATAAASVELPARAAATAPARGAGRPRAPAPAAPAVPAAAVKREEGAPTVARRTGATGSTRGRGGRGGRQAGGTGRGGGAMQVD